MTSAKYEYIVIQKTLEIIQLHLGKSNMRIIDVDLTSILTLEAELQVLIDVFFITFTFVVYFLH